METERKIRRVLQNLSTDPTYKEWKPELLPIDRLERHLARILPTRNGNRIILHRCRAIYARARILPTRNGNFVWRVALLKDTLSTDPTYKEWKRITRRAAMANALAHGSYLQGMETKGARLILDADIVSGHGSYLQGMETSFRISLYSLRCLRTDPTYKEWKRLSNTC